MKQKPQVSLVYARDRQDPNATPPPKLVKVGDNMLVAGQHQFVPESSKRIWCTLCRMYFKGWKAILDYHEPKKTKGGQDG